MHDILVKSFTDRDKVLEKRIKVTIRHSKRVVIKLGTSTLTRGSHNLDRALMLEIVRAVMALKKQGYEVILVSSGAIAAGREFLNQIKLPKDLCYKQMLAAIGQVKIIEEWEHLFAIYKQRVGQILITKADLESRERYLNARDTLLSLLEYDVIPIINENDAVSTQEIKVGDNDNLAALSAILTDADTVLLLTDQMGLYDKDPRTNEDAALIREVETVDDKIVSMALGSKGELGTGGMATKIKAAKTCTEAGITLIIGSGGEPAFICDYLTGKKPCTRFLPSKNPVLAKKSWISAATLVKGTIVVDDGASEALLRHGKSLLPKGIQSVEHEFLRGASVEIVSSKGEVIARGLTRYSSEELLMIRKHDSKEIESLLGFTHGDEAVHRDDMVIFKEK